MTKINVEDVIVKSILTVRVGEDEPRSFNFGHKLLWPEKGLSAEEIEIVAKAFERTLKKAYLK